MENSRKYFNNLLHDHVDQLQKKEEKKPKKKWFKLKRVCIICNIEVSDHWFSVSYVQRLMYMQFAYLTLANKLQTQKLKKEKKKEKRVAEYMARESSKSFVYICIDMYKVNV